MKIFYERVIDGNKNGWIFNCKLKSEFTNKIAIWKCLMFAMFRNAKNLKSIKIYLNRFCMVSICHFSMH